MNLIRSTIHFSTYPTTLKGLTSANKIITHGDIKVRTNRLFSTQKPDEQNPPILSNTSRVKEVVKQTSHQSPSFGRWFTIAALSGITGTIFYVMRGKDEFDGEVAKLREELLQLSDDERSTAKELKAKFEEFLNHNIKDILGSNQSLKALKIKELLESDQSIALDFLLALYKKGDTSALNWYYHHIANVISREAQKSQVETFVKNVVKDFENHVSYSFDMMAKLLSDRKVGYVSIAHLPPFNDVNQSLHILENLAQQGTRKAQQVLASAYHSNRLGVDSDKVNLDLTPDVRFARLTDLAKMSDATAQSHLAQAYFYNRVGDFGPLNLSEEARRQGIKELFNMEQGHNYYLTIVLKDNAIGDLPCHYTRQERFDGIRERAFQRDPNALRVLLHMYRTNSFGDKGNDPLPFSLTPQERLEEIKKLELLNPSLVNDFLASLYLEEEFSGEIYQSLKMNTQERLQLVEDIAFNRKNSLAQSRLTKIYVDVDTIHVDLSTEQRLQKLHQLAKLGCDDAKDALVSFYMQDYSGYYSSDRYISHLPAAQMSEKERFEQIKELVLLGSSRYSEEALLNLTKEPNKRAALKSLFKIRETLYWSGL